MQPALASLVKRTGLMPRSRAPSAVPTIRTRSRSVSGNPSPDRSRSISSRLTLGLPPACSAEIRTMLRCTASSNSPRFRFSSCAALPAATVGPTSVRPASVGSAFAGSTFVESMSVGSMSVGSFCERRDPARGAAARVASVMAMAVLPRIVTVTLCDHRNRAESLSPGLWTTPTAGRKVQSRGDPNRQSRLTSPLPP